MKVSGGLDRNRCTRSLFLALSSMTYHFLVLVRARWIGRGHCAGTTLGVPGWLLMFRSGRNGDGVDWTGIAIATRFSRCFEENRRSVSLTCSCPVVVHRYPKPRRRLHLFRYDLRWFLWWKQLRRVFPGLRPTKEGSFKEVLPSSLDLLFVHRHSVPRMPNRYRCICDWRQWLQPLHDLSRVHLTYGCHRFSHCICKGSRLLLASTLCSILTQYQHRRWNCLPPSLLHLHIASHV